MNSFFRVKRIGFIGDLPSSSGSTGLLTLAWFFQRQSKNHQENERTFKTYFDKAMKLLEDQYEKHIRDPHTQPWLAISHLREKLIPENEQ